MAKPNPLVDLAKRAQHELERDVATLAERLRPEVEAAGAQKLSRADFLALLHRNWGDTSFRLGQLKSMGPKSFLEASKDMVATMGHPVVPGAPMPIPPSKAPFMGPTPSGEAASEPMMPSANVPGG